MIHSVYQHIFGYIKNITSQNHAKTRSLEELEIIRLYSTPGVIVKVVQEKSPSIDEELK